MTVNRLPITAQSTIEELVSTYPFVTGYLSEKGVRCIICGEPIWGTLEEAARQKGMDNGAIEAMVKEMNILAGQIK